MQGEANLPEDVKHPIILYKAHHFTVLVVRECHTWVMHNGVKETLMELRSRYWVVQGRHMNVRFTDSMAQDL